MTQYTPTWPHSNLREVFPNIHLVTGTNKVNFNGVELQHSRNMVVIENDKQLILINTVRLDEKDLAAIDALGKVVNIVRIGAFHGRDDAFYVDRYNAKLWALKGMKHDSSKLTDIELVPGGIMPLPGCSLFVFETSLHPEGILHIDQEGGILITCDSIKNWLSADEFFSAETAKLYERQGFFGPATISEVWKQACQVQASDFIRLKAISFRHLLSAHGAPLLNDAYEQVSKTIEKEFGV
jgi:hypothetical protein